MGNTKKIFLAVVTGFFMAAASATTAWADETFVYDWPGEDAKVLVQNESGLILLDDSGGPLRVFSWDGNEGDYDQPARLVDMSGDGTPQIVGSGTPSFLLSADGEPDFSFEEGCRQVVVADLIRGTHLDLICVKDNEIRAYTGDGQFAWSIKPGRNLDRCKTGDINNDTNNDIECRYQGSGESYLRLRGNGEVLSQSADSERFEGVTESIDEFEAADEAVWTGGQQFDLDGDGEDSETLHAEDGALEIRKAGEEEAVARIETDGIVQAAVVKDLDGEGALTVVAATENRIYVIGKAGEEVRELSADASMYNRVPHAEFATVYASGFGDADGEAREAVRAMQDEIADCYASRLRAQPYAGTGRQLMQVMVGEGGVVDQINQRNSSVGDEGVESCARGAVEDADFPAPEGERGTINVNVIFSFRDEEG